ncbi:hypothetical protein E4U24_008282 [Claviceps purpurea]|nr:hypothetical protein E4U24_008282 [Claviceps purpurea]
MTDQAWSVTESRLLIGQAPCFENGLLNNTTQLHKCHGYNNIFVPLYVVRGNIRNARTSSKSLTLPPPADPPYSSRLASDARIMVGRSPGNDRIAVALPRISEARASITGLQTRPLRKKNAAGDLIETTAPPGQYGAIEEKQLR